MEYNFASVSGGKDSTALLLLAIERETPNLHAVFADTGHEHQKTYDYVRYLEDITGVHIRWVSADFSDEINKKRGRLQGYIDGIEDRYTSGWEKDRLRRAVELLHPTGIPFLDLCLWKGRFPSTKARFCSEELKRNPIIEQVQMPVTDAGHTVISWQGVRADESPSRALLKERECVGEFENGAQLWNYRPILNWTVEDVFAMHRKHGVNPNPLYSEGMGRVGCMPCIHARKDELLEISKRFPDEVARVAEWELIVSEISKRGSATFFSASDLGVVANDNTVLGQANIMKFVEWSKTSRGGKQLDMLRSDNDNAPLCSSIYGLCE